MKVQPSPCSLCRGVVGPGLGLAVTYYTVLRETTSGLRDHHDLAFLVMIIHHGVSFLRSRHNRRHAL